MGNVLLQAFKMARLAMAADPPGIRDREDEEYLALARMTGMTGSLSARYNKAGEAAARRMAKVRERYDAAIENGDWLVVNYCIREEGMSPDRTYTSHMDRTFCTLEELAGLKRPPMTGVQKWAGRESLGEGGGGGGSFMVTSAAVHACAFGDHYKTLAVLWEEGADLDAPLHVRHEPDSRRPPSPYILNPRTEFTLSAIEIAFMRKNLKSFSLLAGMPDISVPGGLLLRAAGRKDPRWAAALIDGGMTPFAEDPETGKSPYDIAREGGNGRTAATILERMKEAERAGFKAGRLKRRYPARSGRFPE